MRILTAIIIFLAAATLIAGGAVYNYFKAKSDGNVIAVQWRSNSEKDVSRYEILRSSDSEHYFRIHSEKPKGDFTNYSHVDESAYKTGGDGSKPMSANVYSYKLKIVFDNGDDPVYSSAEFVTHKVSGVKRTWGMIKEMFK